MTIKNILRSIGVLALFVLLMHGSTIFADEITGTLSTGITATVGNSLTGTVTAPVTAPVSSTGGSGGGGSTGGSGNVSVRSTPSPVISTPTIPTPAPVSTGIVLGASTYNFARELSLGSNGADVTALQDILSADGYLALATPTGYFGVLTKAAVVKFQAAHSIRATGYVGPLTRAVLNTGTIPTIAQENISMSVIANLEEQIATLEAELAQILASSTISTATK